MRKSDFWHWFLQKKSVKEKLYYTSEHFEKFGVIWSYSLGEGKSSLGVILQKFLIFGKLSLDDSYKLNSYKKKCVGISWISWSSLESCNENFFDEWKFSLRIILSIFLIFGDLSLDDSYKLNSYKRKCVLRALCNWYIFPRC